MSKNERLFIAITSFSIAAALILVNLKILFTYGLGNKHLYLEYFKNYINLLIPAVGFIGVGFFLLSRRK
ncbi:MAG: hypothetical protein H7A34_00345 [bacterium]|nr:hypothetical protein [bacterium]